MDQQECLIIKHLKNMGTFFGKAQQLSLEVLDPFGAIEGELSNDDVYLNQSGSNNTANQQQAISL